MQICITLDCGVKYFIAMRTLNVENRPILIDELVEFEKHLVEVEDFKTLLIILEEFGEYT